VVYFITKRRKLVEDGGSLPPPQTTQSETALGQAHQAQAFRTDGKVL